MANEDNSDWGTDGGSDTEDEVFLLSEAEACDAAYGFDGEARRCKASDYAHAMGAWRSTDGGYEGNCWWWLRSPGCYASCAASVYNYGYVSRYGDYVYDGYGAVRPALNLNLSSPHLKAAGTVSSDGAPAEAGGGHAQAPANSPVIGVTHVLAYGTWDEDVRGRVFREDGVSFDPTAYRVAMFIQLYAGGKFWPKPYYTRPYASVSEDGTFQGDVTTGGYDSVAEIIHLFLVPGDYDSGDIADARERAIDYVGIYRSEDGGISVTPDRKVPRIAKGKTYKKSGMRYKVTRVATASRKGTVTLTKAKNAKTVKVPASVRLADGRVYCVTAVSRGALKGLSKTTTVVVGSKVAKIAAGAFNNLPRLTSVTLGTGVKKVGKGAFANTPKLRTITVKSKLLKKKSAVKGMFKGSKVKKAVTVKVPKSMRKTYRKVFTKSNLACPKKVVVK